MASVAQASSNAQRRKAVARELPVSMRKQEESMAAEQDIQEAVERV
jgi:hypothetical protein